jgi:tRNA pseudouridine38-40 synthase
LQLVKDVSSEYLGSHNFHNFTSGKKFTDPSARRHMFSIDVSLFKQDFN